MHEFGKNLIIKFTSSKKAKVQDGLNYKLLSYEDDRFLYLPVSDIEGDLSLFCKFLNETKEEYYTLVITENEVPIDLSNVLSIIRKSSKFDKLYSLSLEPYESKPTSSFEFEKIKCFSNLEFLECGPLTISQYHDLNSVVPYVFSNGDCLELKDFEGLIYPSNAINSTIGDHKISLTNSKYATCLHINSTFDFNTLSENFSNLISVCKNLDNIVFDLNSFEKNSFHFAMQILMSIKNNDIFRHKNLNIVFNSKQDNQFFNEEELKNLSNFEKYLSFSGDKLTFSSEFLYMGKNFEEINDASRILNVQAEFICDPKNHFSVLEKYLLCYYFAKQYQYGENETNVMKSRNAVDLVINKSGVCVAFNDLFQNLLSRTNIKFVNDNVILKNEYNNEKEMHCRTLLRLEDVHYGVRGLFVGDATFGAYDNEKGDKSFCFALLPINQKIKGLDIDSSSPIIMLKNAISNENNSFIYSLLDSKSFVVDLSNQICDLFGEETPYIFRKLQTENAELFCNKAYLHLQKETKYENLSDQKIKFANIVCGEFNKLCTSNIPVNGTFEEALTNIFSRLSDFSSIKHNPEEYIKFNQEEVKHFFFGEADYPFFTEIAKNTENIDDSNL